MPNQVDFGPIYQRLLTHCAPYHHDGLWQDLPVPEDIRCLPATPDAMINDLRQQFSDAQLLEAGVVVMEENVAVQPDPMLCEEDGLIVALRREDKQDPFELLTRQGILSGRMLPVCASLRDGRVQELIQATGDNLLCAATSMPDLALLMSLDLPATLAFGLAELGGNHLRQVQEDFKLYPPQPTVRNGLIHHDDEDEDKKENEKEKPLDLILIGWRLAALVPQELPLVGQIASHLAKVEEYLRVPCEQFCKWQPTEQDLKRIEFAMQHAGLETTWAAILESIDSSTVEIIPARQAASPPADLAQEMQRIKEQKAAPCRDVDEQRRTWQAVLGVIHDESIARLQEAAQCGKDPIERDLSRLVAINGAILYPQLIRLAMKSTADTKHGSPGSLVAFPDKEFRQAMELVDRQQKLLKSLADYQKNPFRAWK